MAALEKELPLSEFARLLAENIRRRQSWAFKLYADYRLGLPIQRNENEMTGELIVRVEYAENRNAQTPCAPSGPASGQS